MALVGANAAAIDIIRVVTGFSTVSALSMGGFAAVTLASALGFLTAEYKSKLLPKIGLYLICIAALAPILVPWMLSRILPDGIWQTICLALLTAVIGVFGVTLHRASRLSGAFGKGCVAGLACSCVFLSWLVVGTEISPWTFERGLYGVQHKDTMFHASIAQMLGKYGVQAIGVDAFDPTPYHVLSHKVIWGLSALTATPVLKGYMLFIYLTGAPLLLFFSTVAGAQVAKMIGPDAPLSNIACALFGLAALAIFDVRSFLASESYLVSLIVFFLFVYVTIVALANDASGIVQVGLVSAVLVLLASQSKISTGAVMVPMAITSIVILAKFRTYSFIVAPLIYLPILYLVLKSQALDQVMDEDFFQPFHYLIDYHYIAKPQILFAALTGFALWRTRSTMQKNWRLLLVMLAGFSAGYTAACLVYLPAGSAYYFSGPGLWCVALVFVGCLKAGFVSAPILLRGSVALLAIAFIVDATEDIPKYHKNLQHFEVAVELQGATPLLARVNEAVQELSGDRLDRTAVHMSSTNESYWNLTEIDPRKNQCWAIAFYMTAVTGLPSLNGLPPLSRRCEIPDYYGLSRHIGAEAPEVQLDQQELCQLARQKLVTTVIVFSDQAFGRKVTCADE